MPSTNTFGNLDVSTRSYQYAIEACDIHKSFGAKHVLKGVDLEIYPGQIYGLLGPSGCGKTTLIKILAGISEATSGKVRVLGEIMPQLALMNRIGYMGQSDSLYGSLTAAENLHFFAAIYGMSNAAIKSRSMEVAKLLNLSDDLHKPVALYSGGMKRRLSLAIALMHNPEILLLDEPTVGLDPILRQDIWKEFYKLSEQGSTLMVTTHVMDEADKCHSLALMRDGVLIARGTAADLQQKAKASSIEEAFIYYGRRQYES